MEEGLFLLFRGPRNPPPVSPLSRCAPPTPHPRCNLQDRGWAKGVASAQLRQDASWVSCSGIVTGIYTTSSPEACQYIAHDCQANIIVVDTQKQLEKILKVWGSAEVGWGPEARCPCRPPAYKGRFPPLPPGAPPSSTATHVTHIHTTRPGSLYLPTRQVGTLRPRVRKGPPQVTIHC